MQTKTIQVMAAVALIASAFAPHVAPAQAPVVK